MPRSEDKKSLTGSDLMGLNEKKTILPYDDEDEPKENMSPTQNIFMKGGPMYSINEEKIDLHKKTTTKQGYRPVANHCCESKAQQKVVTLMNEDSLSQTLPISNNDDGILLNAAKSSAFNPSVKWTAPSFNQAIASNEQIYRINLSILVYNYLQMFTYGFICDNFTCLITNKQGSFKWLSFRLRVYIWMPQYLNDNDERIEKQTEL